MNYFEKNRRLKDLLIGILFILAMVVIISNFVGVSEAAVNKDATNNGFISKNLEIKNITISKNTKGGLKGAIKKSKSGDTIYLKKGVYKFNNINIKVNKTLTIIGKGSAKYVVIDARNKGRIFNIQESGKLVLINVTIKNGRVSGEYSCGGAIYNKGSLFLNKCIFTKNCAIASGYSSGGAIYNVGSLKLKNSVFKLNAGDFGGAIFCGAKYPTYVTNSKFLDNKGSFGTAISNDEDLDNLEGYSSKIIIKRSYFKNCGIENWNAASQIIYNKFDIIYYDDSNIDAAIENIADNTTITYNTIISRGYGLYYGINLFLGNDNRIQNNKFYGNFEYGIYVVGVKNIITGNHLYGKNKKGIGICLDCFYDGDIDEGPDISKYNKVVGNKIVKFNRGIHVYKGLKTNKISYNKLINNNIGLASSYKFKNKTNIFKGNKKNIIKIKG